jgi:hypothetical protein
MVPHVAARKTHQRLLNFSFVTPKRLLQLGQQAGPIGLRRALPKLAAPRGREWRDNICT